MTILESIESEIKLDTIYVLNNIAWLNHLNSNKFLEAVHKLFTSQENIKSVQFDAQEVVQSRIYIQDHKKQTKRLLRSITTTASSGDSEEFSSINVFSDPSVSPAKIPSGPYQSYIVFFERPVEFNTFLQPRGIAKRKANYRPFFNVMQRTVFKQTKSYARNSFKKAMQDSEPAILKSSSVSSTSIVNTNLLF